MVRGEIYWVRLEPRSGSEQTGQRPCVVVSHNSFNSATAWASISVVPCTSSARWQKPSPTTVRLKSGEAGLSQDCAALAHQITTVDRSKLLEPSLGRLSQPRILELDRALGNYLDLRLAPESQTSGVAETTDGRGY